MPEAKAPLAEVVLDLRGLTRDYGATRALAGVALQVRRGEVFGYLGANGAGKTTTIKILTGLIHPPGLAVSMAARVYAVRRMSRLALAV